MSEIERINNRQQLVELASKLGVRDDWHEPDEQKVDAQVLGDHLDNAGFWGEDNRELPFRMQELYVQITRDHDAVAEVNLADLLAWASEVHEAPVAEGDLSWLGPQEVIGRP